MPNLLQTSYLLEPSPNVLIIFKGLLASVVFLHGQGKGLERRFGYYMKLSLLHLLKSIVIISQAPQKRQPQDQSSHSTHAKVQALQKIYNCFY